MKKWQFCALLLFCATLCLLFAGCGEAVLPSVGDRPQAGGEIFSYEPPAKQTISSDGASEGDQIPAYWKGQSQTLPEELLEPSESENPDEPSEPENTEPPYTTASTPNPSGEGRGDAYEVPATDTNGNPVTVQCTPFF